ncbi:hypothetical protein [uncultured Megasphaera sp.]|uniref:hypothetical protein n=1 Tax=uncultured Megasphaera sp. TaxID=165188 RepID=UPI00338E1011
MSHSTKLMTNSIIWISPQIVRDKEMADNHSKEIRSKNMSHIRSTNTKPEECVKKYLFSRGLRYRKNVQKLPGGA